MKPKPEIPVTTGISSALLAAALFALPMHEAQAQTQAAAAPRIPLTKAMLINEAALGDAGALVDEQDAIGDPGAGKGVRPTKPFFPGWTAWQYPLSVIVDLGAEYRLTRLCLFNESGENKIRVGIGKPFAWTESPQTLSGYRAWQSVPLPATTRFVRLTLTHPASLPEIALYGERTGPAVAPTRPAAPKAKPVQPTMDQFIGTNAFIDDPIEKLTPPWVSCANTTTGRGTSRTGTSCGASSRARRRAGTPGSSMTSTASSKQAG
jgi:hypothetical protein